MKKILVLLLLVVVSCSDEKTAVIDTIPKQQKLFELSDFGTRIFENGIGKLCTLKIKSSENVAWAMKFWDTTKIVNLQSSIIEMKSFDGSLPVYNYFAIAETNDGYLFGSQDCALIDKYYFLPFYVFNFLIPIEPKEGDIEIEYDSLKIGFLDYYCERKAEWSILNKSILDSADLYYCVKSTLKRTNYDPLIEGYEAGFKKDSGMVRIRDYFLKKKLSE